MPEPLSCCGLSKDTLRFIDGSPGLGDLSANPDRWLVISPRMRGAATLSSVAVIKDWLSRFSTADSLDRVTEGINDEDTEFGPWQSSIR